MEDLSGSLSVVIPCFNEVDTLEGLLRQVRDALPSAQVILIDDGSTDGSGRLAKALAKELEIELIVFERNYGKGEAVRNGIEKARRRYTVIQDADLEYDPKDIRRLLEHARGSDIAIYGSRYLNRGRSPGAPLLNYYGVKLLAILLLALHRRWLTDPHTCYKLLSTQVAKEIGIQSRGFELCAEINSKLLSRGVEIAEIPISYQGRANNQGKKIGWKDFVRTVKAYWKFRRPQNEPRAKLAKLAFWLTAITAASMFVSGGPLGVRAMLRGEWLFIPKDLRIESDAPSLSVEIPVKNLSTSTVYFYGYSVGCNCLEISLPESIPPLGSGTIGAQIAANSSVDLSLWTSLGQAHQMRVIVQWVCVTLVLAAAAVQSPTVAKAGVSAMALGTCKAKADGNCESAGASCTLAGQAGLCSDNITESCDCDTY